MKTQGNMRVREKWELLYISAFTRACYVSNIFFSHFSLIYRWAVCLYRATVNFPRDKKGRVYRFASIPARYAPARAGKLSPVDINGRP